MSARRAALRRARLPRVVLAATLVATLLCCGGCAWIQGEFMTLDRAPVQQELPPAPLAERP